MQTSYYGNVKNLKGKNLVAISQGVPKWWKGRIYKALAPSWYLIKLKDEDTYTQKFNEILDNLDAREVVKVLGEDAILLCWEKPGEFCHRRLVAEWLERELGIKVPEYGQE